MRHEKQVKSCHSWTNHRSETEGLHFKLNVMSSLLKKSELGLL